MEIVYPLVAMTHYCFNTLPPPGSTCNCSTPPPAFNVKFPLDFTTTEETTTTSTPDRSIPPSYKTEVAGTKPDTGTQTGSSSSSDPVTSPTTPHGQNGTEPWVIILIVCFILIACIALAIIVFCYLKKHGYLVKCKVHPDGKCSDEEKMTDLGPDVAAESDTSSRTPLNGTTPEAAAAAVATETGANPSDQNGVRKVYKKGSVELKPLNHPSAPLPISRTSPLRRPSEGNLTEPETDHPEFLGDQHMATGAAAGVTTGVAAGEAAEKPKKRKKKKKKKPAANNPDAVQDGNNTEDPPNG